MVLKRVEFVGLSDAFGSFREFLWREFSFITGNYRILVFSWIVMDLEGDASVELPVLR